MALIEAPGSAETVLRIALAFGLAFLFGLERQFRKKPVGFGTFTFVCTGSAALIVVALRFSETPTTVFGAIVTGIGFLGAGTIIKAGDKKVTGITTAASIWAFAALGITLGAGFYDIAAVLYILIIAIITIDHRFETRGFGAYSRAVTVMVNDIGKVREIEKLLPEKHKTTTYSFDKSKKEYTFSFYMSGNKREINTTLNDLLKQDGVINVKIE